MVYDKKKKRGMKMSISEEEVREMLRLSARQMGLLYLSIANVVLEKHGESGKDLLLKAIKNYGRIRGSRIAEKVKRAGQPLTLENYFKYYDVPVTTITKQSRPQMLEKGKFLKKITACPLAEFFREENEQEIGRLYCEQDFAMVASYNPKIRFEKGKSLMEGDECCEFTFLVPQDMELE
jgi:hypothetical protein